MEFETPAEDPSSWFNILVLHQNRAKRGPTSYIPESFLPDFFHLVIWGHEHDCRIVPEASDKDFFVCQPGSPTATSLCEGEAIQKCVGILNIRADTKFKLDPIPLQTVRPMVFKTIAITDLKKVDLTESDTKRLSNAIETQLKYEVEEMIAEAENLLTGHPKQGTRPMLRLRVEYTDENQQLNSARFGNNFLESVSNAGEILLFKRKTAERKVKVDNFDMDAMNELGEESNVTMEDLVKEYFNSQTDDKNKLSVLDVKGVGAAVKSYIEKDDKDALKCAIDKAMEKAYNSLLNREQDDDEDINEHSEDAEEEINVEQELLKKRKDRKIESPVQRKGKKRDELFDSDEDTPVIDSDEDLAPTRATRGRGRARGTRGGTVTARGRASVKAAVKSPAKRGRGRAPAQSTIAAAFARSQQTSRLSQPSQASARPSQRNKKQMFESDSDEDLLGAL